MADFFGDLERLAADAYPWRWWIMGGLAAVLAATSAFAFRRGWHRWVWRHRLPVGIVGAPLLALAIYIGYDLGSPLFTNKTVEEEFPFAASAVVPPGMERKDVEAIFENMAKINQEAVSEEMPAVAAVEVTAGGADGREVPGTPPPAPSAATSSQTPAPEATAAGSTQPAVVKVKAGSFRDQDSFHKGSGQATIYRGSDGALLLRLENLNVTNGPDLHVILSPHKDPGNQGDVKAPGYIDLGKLKGNRGNQNYPVPNDVDVAAQGSVVIYCVPFNVIFSVASLQDAG